MTTLSAAPAPAYEREASTLKLGVLVFIVSEAMLFAGFFAAYFLLRGIAATWPPTPEIERPELPLVTLNTIFLVTSSVTLQWAIGRVLAGDQRGLVRGIAVTLLLGSVFLAIQAFEFSRNGFTISDGVFGSTFYTLTGFHGAHVAAGLVLLAAVLRRARRGLVTAERHVAVEAASYYWHFVDVVWLVLFTTVYVL